jgi:hypothetical protein
VTEAASGRAGGHDQPLGTGDTSLPEVPGFGPIRTVATWLGRSCVDCGLPKPRLTAYCDHCAERHDL